MLLLSGCAATPKSRSEALSTLGRLRGAGAPVRASGEFRSIEETFTRAEAFQRGNDREMAEKLYLLSMVKGKLLEEQIAGGEETHVSNPVADGPGNHPTSEPFWDDPADSDLQVPEGAIPVVEESPVEPDLPIGNQPFPVGEGSVVPDSGVPAGASRDQKTVGTATDRTAQHTHPPVVKSDRIIGGEEHYVVKKGDTLGLIGAKLGVSWRFLAKINNLDPKNYLYEGQELRVVNRRIIPKKVKDGLVINIPDRMMYYFKRGRLKKSIPVALGKPSPKDSEEDDVVWHTPTGVFKILAKEKDPIWRVPPSIQKEMEEQGKEVLTKVPPGDKNPLGKFALRTSIPGIMIHSTIRPSSIYGFSSHGCIRVSPVMMEELFNEIEINTRGEIIYKPIKVAVTDDGRVFLEVHRDVYDKKVDFEKEVKEMILKNRAADKVDWKKVNLVLRNKLGIAEEVTYTR
jgi:L,D-transpeptidase ErfK/SrfK